MELLTNQNKTIPLEITTMGTAIYHYPEAPSTSCDKMEDFSSPIELLFQYIRSFSTHSHELQLCKGEMTVDSNIIHFTTTNQNLLNAIAFFSLQVNVVRIDLLSHYSVFPTTSHSLRSYTQQEVMSTREEVQAFYNHNIHGEGRVIGLSDTGIDVHSCFFMDSEHPVRYDSSSNDTNHRKISLYVPFMNAVDDEQDGHGTHVAGTLVGETNEGSFSEYNGIAYKARVAFIDIGKKNGKEVELTTPRKVSQLIEQM